MTPTEFRHRVDACLDTRRDPLDDDAVVAFLDAHPDQLAAFAAQRADLAALARQPRCAAAATGTRRRHATPAAVLAATVAVAAGLVLATRDAPTRNERPPRIVAASLEVLRPLARAAGGFTVRHMLVDSATVTFETYHFRNQAR
jgi:hypothetical protein